MTNGKSEQGHVIRDNNLIKSENEKLEIEGWQLWNCKMKNWKLENENWEIVKWQLGNCMKILKLEQGSAIRDNNLIKSENEK